MAQPLVSIVVPLLNEAPCLPKLHEELVRVCDRLPYRFEWVFVDDGSTDATPDVLADLRQKDERVRYMVLSRNFGHQAALSAGLSFAAGDAVIMMDGDLQHPPTLIPTLLERWHAGHEIVNTIRHDSGGSRPLKRVLSAAFYRVFNWFANTQLRPGGADFRLMDRAIVNLLNDLPERQRFWRGLVPWLGFRQAWVEFTAPPRFAGRPKFTLYRSARFALDGITSFSFYPLRRLVFFGWVIVLASFVYALWALWAHLVLQHTVEGWTSLILCVLFLGGCQLMTLGIIGEYVGRVLEQVKGRPMYVVRQAVGAGPQAANDGAVNHAAVSAGTVSSGKQTE
jgi:dolichol-phosphate mannosyltransferase